MRCYNEYDGFCHEQLFEKKLGDLAVALSSAVVYALTLLAIGFFDENELKSLPLSAVWIKINKVFRRIRNAIT